MERPMKKSFSLFLRITAFSLATASLVGRNPAAKTFQAAPFVPVPNMVAYWNLDETTGTTANDSSGNNNTGSYYNTPVPSTDVPPVPVGNVRSLSFVATGSTQRVAVNDSLSLRISGPMTVSAWVKPTIDTPSYQKGIIEKWTQGASAIDGYMFRLGWSSAGNNVPTFTLGNGATQAGAATGTPLTNGQWTHVAGVYDGSNLLLYVNGLSSALTPNTSAPTNANTQELHIGSDYGTNVFTGNIDEARLYNRGLTPSEILILHGGQAAPTAFAAVGGNQQNDLSWAAAPGAATYSVLRGTSPGVYDTVYNGITGTTYTDNTNVTPGLPYYYVVVAVSVMVSPYSTEQTATANNAPPPPPPPPPGPRAPKGSDSHNRCGCATAIPAGLSPDVAGAALVALLLLTRLRRR
jgi:MYXO-CTERM domain-containing protein